MQTASRSGGKPFALPRGRPAAAQVIITNLARIAALALSAFLYISLILTKALDFFCGICIMRIARSKQQKHRPHGGKGAHNGSQKQQGGPRRQQTFRLRVLRPRMEQRLRRFQHALRARSRVLGRLIASLFNNYTGQAKAPRFRYLRQHGARASFFCAFFPAYAAAGGAFAVDKNGAVL